MKPMYLRRSSASSSGDNPLATVSSTRTVPDVGVRMQPRIDSNVVLPLPDGPISSVSSPGASAMVTPFSA